MLSMSKKSFRNAMKKARTETHEPLTLRQKLIAAIVFFVLVLLEDRDWETPFLRR